MTNKSLYNCPALLNKMDDNLTISISEFMKTKEISAFNLSKEELTEIINSSARFSFNASQDKMQIKERPQRRTILFGNLKDDWQANIKLLIETVDATCKDYKMENRNDLIYVQFETEEMAIEIIKKLESHKYEKVSLYVKIRMLLSIFV